MLSKSQRLNLKTNFKWVASGKHLQSPSFKLMIKEGENKSPKIGVAISSKNFKMANLRNKAKRLSFAAVAPLYPTLKSNTNLVIMPKPDILNKNIEQLSEELKGLIK